MVGFRLDDTRTPWSIITGRGWESGENMHSWTDLLLL